MSRQKTSKPQPGRPRHNLSDRADLSQRLADRDKLRDMRAWADELSRTLSFRDMARYLCRGDRAYGYWQSVARGKHLAKPPQIRPTWEDYHSLKQLRAVAMRYAAADKRHRDRAFEIMRALATLQKAVTDFVIGAPQ